MTQEFGQLPSIDARSQLDNRTDYFHNRSRSEAPTKKTGSQTSSPIRVFRQSQEPGDFTTVFSEDPVLLNLNKQLDGSIGMLDNKFSQVIHKHEGNFLTAYRGVMRDVAHSLNYYKKELEKYSEEYQDSENERLKKQLAIIKEQVESVLKSTRSVESENKRLKENLIKLKQDSHSDKTILQSLQKKKSRLEKLSSDLKGQQTPIILESRSALPTSELQDAANSEVNRSHRFLPTDASLKDKLTVFATHADRSNTSSNENLVLSSRNRLKSFANLSMIEEGSSKSQGELRFLRETICGLLAKELQEQIVKELSEQIVQAANRFFKDKVKEVKVLKETIEQMKRSQKQQLRMLGGRADLVGISRPSSHSMLSKIFAECVRETTTSLHIDPKTISSSHPPEEENKQLKNEACLKTMERYLGNSHVVTVLEDIIAEESAGRCQSVKTHAPRMHLDEYVIGNTSGTDISTDKGTSRPYLGDISIRYDSTERGRVNSFKRLDADHSSDEIARPLGKNNLEYERSSTTFDELSEGRSCRGRFMNLPYPKASFEDASQKSKILRSQIALRGDNRASSVDRVQDGIFSRLPQKQQPYHLPPFSCIGRSKQPSGDRAPLSRRMFVKNGKLLVNT